MYNQIAIVYNHEESPMPIRRVLSTINHMAVHQVTFVPADPKKFKASAKKNPTPLRIDGAKAVLLVGTDIINAALGSVRGRNAAVEVDGVWYLTINNMSALFFPDIALDSAKQFLKAIKIIDDGGYRYPKVERYLITNLIELQDMVDEAIKADYVAYDYETNNELKVHSPTFRTTCLVICYTPGFVWVLPEELLYAPGCSEILSQLFSAPLVKIAHNASFDIKILWKHGVKVKHRLACTKLMSFIIDENTSSGLKENIDKYLPEFSGYDHKADFNKVDDTLYEYASIDAHCTLLLYCIFMREIVEDDFFYPMYRNIYIPAMEVLAEMEFKGANLDVPYLDESITNIEKEIEYRISEFAQIPEVKKFVILKNEESVQETIDELQAKIDNRAIKFTSEDEKFRVNWTNRIKNLRVGEEVVYQECNIGSPKELAELLYSDKGFGFKKPMRPTGAFKNGKRVFAESDSTDKEALNDIDHPVGEMIRVIRSFQQLLGTFYKSIREKEVDGMLYAAFNQTGTVTGRLSSSDPNLQNLPTRIHLNDDTLKKVVKGVKKAFVAPPGYNILAADLSQAELRVIAHYSQDENMIEAYNKGLDLHAITGQRIAKVPTFDEFLKSPDYKKFRTIAKSANFGLVYDISDDGYIEYIKAQTGETITKPTALLHREAVFGAYPKLKVWHKDMETLVRTDGFVRTIHGLKRRLPGVYSSNQKEVGDAIRLAINNPVQGTIGLYALWLIIWIKHRYPDFRLFTTVHDSIVGYCPIGLEDEVYEDLKNTKTNLPTKKYLRIADLSVPLVVDVEIGKNYGETEEFVPKSLAV